MPPSAGDRLDTRHFGHRERIDVDSARLRDFTAESNRIEHIGITTRAEVKAHEELLALDTVTVEDLEHFVSTIQPDAKLRRHPGMDVRVGSHVPPRGGPGVERDLHALLTRINVNDPGPTPWQAHVEYEMLHPFQDGNGRSGRALWAWQMLREGRDPFALGFMHSAYYEALAAGSDRS